MPDLPVLARTPLPEPLTWISPLFSHDGRRAVVPGESGRLWLLEIDPARRAIDVQPLPIILAKRREEYWALRTLAGSHTLDRLLVWTDRMRVYALPSGELVGERDGPIEGVGAACLTPDGHWLLCMEEERAWVAEVDAPESPRRETWAFHESEPPFEHPDGEEPAGFVAPEPEPVYLDHVDTLAVHPRPGAEDDEDGTFWLAAGCYGFVVTHLAWGSRWRGVDGRVEGKTRTFGGLVYDPTQLMRPFGARHLFVLHGLGAGLAALDPETGERHDCAVRGSTHPYTFFEPPAISADAPIAVVQCRDGAFLWVPGVRLEPLAGVPGKAWKVYGEEILCAAGGELVWARLPSAPSTLTLG